jgi:hypothetical protein
MTNRERQVSLFLRFYIDQHMVGWVVLYTTQSMTCTYGNQSYNQIKHIKGQCYEIFCL